MESLRGHSCGSGIFFPPNCAVNYCLCPILEIRIYKTRAAIVLMLICTACACSVRSQESREIARNDPGASGKPEEAPPTPPAVRPTATSTLEVKATQEEMHPALAPVQEIAGREILSSAGTYGDLSRYLQVLPGVVWNSDLSNDVLVRSGHPEENLYVIDGVEFDGISHLQLPGTTGGFTSMIDSTAVGSMEMRPGVYDADHSSRLSSLIEIHTRQLADARQESILSIGISGIGELYQRALPHSGTLLVSAHRSILNFFTDNIGIGGVPVYTNLLARVDVEHGRDSLTILSLGGIDSVQISPCADDPWATNFYQTQYAGRRETGALTWKHAFNAALASDLTASYSVTRRKIEQQQQIYFVEVNGRETCAAIATPSYLESSRDGLPRLNYTLRASRSGWLFSSGAGGSLQMLGDSVAQLISQPSPFSASTTAGDAAAFHQRFSTGQEAVFVQAEGPLGKRLSLMGGVRAEGFAIDGSHALEPRVSILYRLNQRQSLHASWNASAQLPPTMDLLSFPGNRPLQPITVRQTAAGMRLFESSWGALDAEAYTRQYRREPVSTEFPQLMLFNTIDTLGQSIVWLPLTGTGSAESRGLEAVLRAHWQSRAQLLLSATASHSEYRALDGILRKGNYDTPASISALTSFRLPARFALNSRESFTSGRVYTPFDMPDSLAQDRGIYDLSRINAMRGPVYNRLDLEFERQFSFSRGQLDVRGGAENVLNRGNLLGYVWLQNCKLEKDCADVPGPPFGKVDQIERFPVFSAQYRF